MGHGSFWAGAGGGEEMRAFWAKVAGRSFDGDCGGLDARDEKGELFELGEEANALAG